MTNPYDPYTEQELHEQYAHTVDEPTADDAYLTELDDEQRAKLAAEHAAETHARAVADVAERLRARAEAEKLIAAAARPPMPHLERLDHLLARPIPPAQYLVDKLWPRGGRVILAAAAKSGKTHVRDNLARCLVDGERFLRWYDVSPPRGTVTILDTEMDDVQMQRWLRDQGIRNQEQVYTVAMRGKVSAFDLLDDGCRDDWAAHLRAVGTGVLILDCLGPVLSSAGLDEGKPEIGRWLNAFEAMTQQAGIGESLIIHHMGHIGERSRGHSRLRDWPDVEWQLLKATDRDGGEDDGPRDKHRYFSAFGRDVDESERQLQYDPMDRHVWISGEKPVSRREAKARQDVPAVVAYVRDHPGQSGRQLEEGLGDGGLSRTRARNAVRAAVRQDEIHYHQGDKRSQIHFITGECALCAPSARPPEVGAQGVLGE